MIYHLKLFFKSLYRLLTDTRYRYFIAIYQRYGRSKGEGTKYIKFEQGSITAVDPQSFVWQYKELLVDEIYKFDSSKPNPLIIDCGANIGLSCIYFKKRFPQATIIAFEADPAIANVLKQNLIANTIEGVEVISKAVWIHNEGIQFVQDGSDGGAITNSNAEGIHINSIRLKDFLKQFSEIDFLKMDIEGAETTVLSDCKEELSRVDKLFVEYHSFVGQEQTLPLLLNVLKENDFRYFIQTISDAETPFLPLSKTNGNIDLQLNIFAWK